MHLALSFNLMPADLLSVKFTDHVEGPENPSKSKFFWQFKAESKTRVMSPSQCQVNRDGVLRLRYTKCLGRNVCHFRNENETESAYTLQTLPSKR